MLRAEQSKGQRLGAGCDITRGFFYKQVLSTVAGDIAEARQGRLERADRAPEDDVDLIGSLDQQAVVLIAFDGARHQRHDHAQQ